MSDTKDILDTKDKLHECVGRRAMFHVDNVPSDKVFNFCSTLEGIGKGWDCTQKNNTEVLILSEPVEIAPLEYVDIGIPNLILTRVMAHAAMWVLTEQVVLIEVQ